MESFIFPLDNGELIDVYQAWTGDIVACFHGTCRRAEIEMSASELADMYCEADETKAFGESERSDRIRRRLTREMHPVIPEFTPAIAAE